MSRGLSLFPFQISRSDTIFSEAVWRILRQFDRVVSVSPTLWQITPIK
ncbi:Hypothetical protein ETEE_3779 [Edwardsiella anguillarum ET080813]|uniref:Uncharacterized protein n=1 Tax=Edwardsiella anguillarum ET080813 TaxID=667120 RepID=A0A076LQE0_9GAMM|nr:Hypothetical protein ETEE_3779 [Edwardsiella anguillarum ET080813]